MRTPPTAVRVDEDSFRTMHNDTDETVELIAISQRTDGETERREDFWPQEGGD